MPKMKSHRGAAKRFRKTGSGNKIRRNRAMKGHIMTKKRPKRKRRLRKPALISGADMKRTKRMLAGG